MIRVLLKESTLDKEGACLVSKWLEFPIVLSLEELKDLFAELGAFYVIHTDRIVSNEEGILFPEEFLKIYEQYITTWKEGGNLNDSLYKKVFQGAISTTLDGMYAIKVDDSRRIVKTTEPTLLLQPYRIEYSSFDHKFRPMVMSKNSLSWGLQISYPQLYQDAKTGVLKKVDETFVNSALFRKLQKWVRYHTQPTTFLIQEKEEPKQITMPMRIGKEALLFVNNHSGLAEKQIEVITRGSKK